MGQVLPCCAPKSGAPDAAAMVEPQAVAAEDAKDSSTGEFPSAAKASDRSQDTDADGSSPNTEVPAAENPEAAPQPAAPDVTPRSAEEQNSSSAAVTGEEHVQPSETSADPLLQSQPGEAAVAAPSAPETSTAARSSSSGANLDEPIDGKPIDSKEETVNFKDGSVYTGQIVNDKRHGYGTYRSPNKQYKGQWSNDFRDGRGTQFWKDGRTYEGEFRSGQLHGFGKMVWKVKEGIMAYEGQYQENLKQGKGKFTWADGRTYDGEWHHGTRHGEGVFHSSWGVKKQGIWANDKLLRWLDRDDASEEAGSSPTHAGSPTHGAAQDSSPSTRDPLSSPNRDPLSSIRDPLSSSRGDDVSGSPQVRSTPKVDASASSSSDLPEQSLTPPASEASPRAG